MSRNYSNYIGILLKYTELIKIDEYESCVQEIIDNILNPNDDEEIVVINYIKNPCPTQHCAYQVTALLAWVLHNKLKLYDPVKCANNIYNIWKEQHPMCYGPYEQVIKTLIEQIDINAK